mmetsp:Transcript_72942/g.237110  ORF Transcript_72942/g.237110 Transcript_72942/m.237110 type:complete len:287 (-) Transcript_72942:1308-2168(-)
MPKLFPCGSRSPHRESLWVRKGRHAWNNTIASRPPPCLCARPHTCPQMGGHNHSRAARNTNSASVATTRTSTSTARSRSHNPSPSRNWRRRHQPRQPQWQACQSPGWSQAWKHSQRMGCSQAWKQTASKQAGKRRPRGCNNATSSLQAKRFDPIQSMKTVRASGDLPQPRAQQPRAQRLLQPAGRSGSGSGSAAAKCRRPAPAATRGPRAAPPRPRRHQAPVSCPCSQQAESSSRSHARGVCSTMSSQVPSTRPASSRSPARSRTSVAGSAPSAAGSARSASWWQR